MNPPETPAAKPNRMLFVAAAVTLAASAWVALRTEDAVPEPVRSRTDTSTRERVQRAGSSAPAPTDSWPEALLAERHRPWPVAVAQGVSAWGPAAPPPAPPAPPATKPVVTAVQPQAPPFPYALIGRLDDGEPRALLSGPLRSFGAKASEVIDGTWRIDSVDVQGMTVTWLPAGLKRTISFASS